jgi:ATP-dependent helicase HepA
LHENDPTAHIEYFLAPTIERKTFIVDRSSIKRAVLYENKRIYWNDPNTAFWRVGRLTISDQQHIEVQFPNKDLKVLPVEEVFVRCAQPIEDPTSYLAGFVTETPLFAQARSKFMRSIIAQRGISQGMSGLLSSSIALEPHQWHVVSQVLKDPIQRYLLADEVGLGKTVEAGVLIRQYILDHPKDCSVVIVVPESLVRQWQNELSLKFHLSSHLDSGSIVIIPSTKLVDQSTMLYSLGMLVIDEAHHIVNGVNSNKETELYRTIKQAAHRVDRLLLLSATPALGNEMAFLALLHLLDPAIYSLADYDSFKEKLQNRQELARIVAALTPENLYFMYEYIDQLLSFFPNDDLLTHHTATLRSILDTNSNEDNPVFVKAVTALRAHISETYKLHRRILRNRRASVSGITPQRIGITVQEYSSDHERLLAEWLEAWRSYVSNQFYGREDSKEYRSFAELHWTYIGYQMSDPDSLAAIVRKRLEHDTQTHDIHFCPLLDGEKNYLLEILMHADSVAKSQDKILAVSSALARVPDEQKVVIFCSAPTVADRLFQYLQGSNHCAVRHSPSGNDWEVFFTSSKYHRYLICDYRAEEGLNLQGCGREILHYDLPFSPNRIEQRMGRLDRYGSGDIITITCLCVDNSYATRWIECLDEGFGIFRSSIASLQYLIDDKMSELKLKIMTDGFQALDELRNALRGEDGLVKCELKNIRQQDELDALSFEPDDQFDRLEDFDAQWENITRDIDEWVEKRMIFRKAPHHIEAPHPPDFVFRYEYLMDNGPKTLMSVDDFFYNCKEAIDLEFKKTFKKRMTYPYTFRRETSYMKKLRLLRFGDDFLNGIMRVAERDDSGTSFAMWRCIPDRKAPTRLFYQFNLIIEANLSPAKNILLTSDKSGEYATEEAFHRLGDLFLPPVMETVWLKETLEQVKNTDTLEILNRNYNKIFDKNINADIWQRLLLESPAHYWNNWEERCYQARHEAERILVESDDFKQNLSTCLNRVQEISQRHLSQLRSRCIKLQGPEYQCEHERILWEERLYETLFEGVVKPSIRVDSTGVVFLSKDDLRRFL